MPYKDKILAAAYQKRTQTPYMRAWREKNRERHRAYMREWARKRRANKEKREMDLAKIKESDSYKRNLKISTHKSKLLADGLADCYVVRCLVKHGNLTTEVVRKNPEIIQIHKKIILTKRLLKNDNYNNKQL